MGTHECEGTYLIAFGQISFGTGYSEVNGADAKTQAENSAMANADNAGAKLANAETCGAPCENPPWFRVTKALVDSDFEEHPSLPTGQKKWWSGSAAVLWSVEISCRKPRPLDEPVEAPHGGAFYALVERHGGGTGLLREMKSRIREAARLSEKGLHAVAPPAETNQGDAARRKGRKHLDTVIAYLSHPARTLFVSASYRTAVAHRWGVEGSDKDVWFLPKRGYSVDVEEVRGFVSQKLMEDKEGDERIRKGYKCGINHPAASKKCSSNSLTSYDYLGYSECTSGEADDTCDEVYVKIGDMHEWTAACRSTWADLPVYEWVCLP